MAHGFSNVLSGLCGGLQNYLCYSNSLLYFRCGGGGREEGLLLALASLVCVWMGPMAVRMVPRALPGCLLLHLGLDLAKEGLWDSAFSGLDLAEYVTVLCIAGAMGLWGMSEGLGLGVLCAALAFTLQAAGHAGPVRRTLRSGLTLRSSRSATVG